METEQADQEEYKTDNDNFQGGTKKSRKSNKI